MIEVENSNDKAPYFTPETQRAEVTEDTPIGTVFTTLKATDPDSTNLEALNFAISEPITAIDRNGQRVNDSKSFRVSTDIFVLTSIQKSFNPRNEFIVEIFIKNRNKKVVFKYDKKKICYMFFYKTVFYLNY